eukprot:GHVU01010906.1.p1 GENE.GHVU01010906.1~~GHVU01010906.1.p1  ORF type:complete len:213 (+),score=15.61 GHVU01010906.1:63-641(+)
MRYIIAAFLSVCTALISPVSANSKDVYEKSDIADMVEQAPNRELGFSAWDIVPDKVRDPISSVTKPLTDPVNGVIEDAGNALELTYKQKYLVKFENACDRTIVVAAHYYLYLRDFSNSWTTSGYWTVKPGQTILTDITTRNRNIYFHAHSIDGKKSWGKDHQWKVKGSTTKPFFKKNMGEVYNTYTQRFSCS